MGFLFSWYTMCWAGSPQSGSGYEILCHAALSFHATLAPEALQLHMGLSCTERTELGVLDSVAQHYSSSLQTWPAWEQLQIQANELKWT